MTCRIPFRARTEVAECKSFMTGSFDTAGKGKSALVVAAFRGLEAAVYTYTEQQVIDALHDVAKFFDIINIPILINKGIEHNFPILDLILTLHQHLAPKVIQRYGF